MTMAMIGAALCGVPSATRADWIPDAEISGSPYTVYIDQQTTFTYTLYNGKSSSVDITDFWVFFDWQASDYGYDLLDYTISLAPYESEDFTVTVTVPQIITGSHTAAVKVTGQAVGDWFDSTGTWTITYSVMEIPPLEVVISANPTSGDAQLTVQFTSYVDGGLSPYTYSWTFGDGQVSSSANPTHVYDSDGTFTVTLVVSDSSSMTESDQVTVTVDKPVLGGTVGDTGVSATILLLAIVIVVVVVTLVVYLAKVRKSSPPKSPPNADPPQQ
jgi:PKD repeat protein